MTRTLSPLSKARAAAELAFQQDPSDANLKALQAAGKAEMDEYLAGFDARHSASEEAPEAVQETETEEIQELVTETETKEIAQVNQAEEVIKQAETNRPFAPWFRALLEQNLTLEDTEWFEEEAYKGSISYEYSMTDGWYAPEPKDKWLLIFRQDALNGLYWGNDSRNKLAPYAVSYALQMKG